MADGQLDELEDGGAGGGDIDVCGKEEGGVDSGVNLITEYSCDGGDEGTSSF